MSRIDTLWRGLVRLFGLDTCPVPAATVAHRETPEQRALRERLERALRRR